MPRRGQFSRAADKQILLAARRLLAVQGLRRTSLADIAKEAKCSERTLYRRFADRNHLLVAVVVRELEEHVGRVQESLDGVNDPEERLVRAFAYLARTLRRHDVLQNLLITDSETILPLVTLQAEPILAVAIAWIVDYIEDAPLVAPADQIAEVIARLTVSLALTPSPTLRYDTDEQAEDLARTLIVPLMLRTGDPPSPGSGPAFVGSDVS